LGVGISTACYVRGLVGSCRASVQAWMSLYRFNRQTRAHCRFKKAIYRHMMALLDKALHGTDDAEGLLGMEHATMCGREKEIVNRMCIFLFRLNGYASSTTNERYNREYHIRVIARVRDSYSTSPL